MIELPDAGMVVDPLAYVFCVNSTFINLEFRHPVNSVFWVTFSGQDLSHEGGDFLGWTIPHCVRERVFKSKIAKIRYTSILPRERTLNELYVYSTDHIWHFLEKSESIYRNLQGGQGRNMAISRISERYSVDCFFLR